MTFLCALEAVNLNNLFGDCEDLSTTRGGGLAVLQIGREVAVRLGAKAVSSGSSQGLLLIEGETAQEVEDRVKEALGDLGSQDHAVVLSHATVIVKACQYHERLFAQEQAELKATIRWSQMRSPTVVYPKLYDTQVCDIDKVRPAVRRQDLVHKQNQSDFTHSRRNYGREQKKALIRTVLGAAAPPTFDVVSEFTEMTSDDGGRHGNLRDKLAVLRFDGNDFGEVGHQCNTPALMNIFAKTTQEQQEGFFRALVSANPEGWWTAGPVPKVRLEIVVYGGDEVTFVTPAWLGWKALRVFYEQAESWPPFESDKESRRLTYSGGVVFCHRNAPIHVIRQLASDLADTAKDRAKAERKAKGNFAVYQALESFDAIGEDLNDFINRRYQFNGGRGVYLGLEEIRLLDDTMDYWRATLSRRKLRDLVQGLQTGEDVEVEKRIPKLVEFKSPDSESAVQSVKELHARMGD